MKNLKFLFLMILFFSIQNAFCQNLKTISLSQGNKPMVVFNNKVVQDDFMKNLKPENIAAVKSLKSSDGVAKYGEKVKNGVIEITSKNISKNQILDLQRLYALEFSSNEKEKKILISGVITDCENVKLSNILIKNLNTQNTTLSNNEGYFEIETNKNDVLEFSAIGLESQRILVKKKTKILIKLKEIPKMADQNIRVLKPVMYLYPTEKMEVNVTFNFDGKLQTTFPEYKQKWEVTAYPNGQLFEKNTKRFYNSLFWDGEINYPDKHFDYKTGFVVSKNDLTSFLINKLEFIGLNNNETNDFVQFWLPILELNNLNFIHFRLNKDYDVISKNHINPSPTSSIRVFIEFYGIDHKISIPEQELEKTERKGFTLVEWGGSDVSSKMKTINNIN
ncbi:hypothetical protein [Flavobacterium sp.]|uniref:hypothetical protein n=1 Tax=Flavobacterium sp. TaxID=239 RepID=UPI00286DD852|nr:hypothetical protein [Flavobacterium sp.]